MSPNPNSNNTLPSSDWSTRAVAPGSNYTVAPTSNTMGRTIKDIATEEVIEEAVERVADRVIDAGEDTEAEEDCEDCEECVEECLGCLLSCFVG